MAALCCSVVLVIFQFNFSWRDAVPAPIAAFLASSTASLATQPIDVSSPGRRQGWGLPHLRPPSQSDAPCFSHAHSPSLDVCVLQVIKTRLQVQGGKGATIASTIRALIKERGYVSVATPSCAARREARVSLCPISTCVPLSPPSLRVCVAPAFQRSGRRMVPAHSGRRASGHHHDDQLRGAQTILRKIIRSTRQTATRSYISLAQVDARRSAALRPLIAWFRFLPSASPFFSARST